MPNMLPYLRGALTAPFHPYLFSYKESRRYFFCCTFPRVSPAGRYPAPCFHGARTFLCADKLFKHSDHPIFLKHKNSTRSHLLVQEGNAYSGAAISSTCTIHCGFLSMSSPYGRRAAAVISCTKRVRAGTISCSSNARVVSVTNCLLISTTFS